MTTKAEGNSLAKVDTAKPMVKLETLVGLLKVLGKVF